MKLPLSSFNVKCQHFGLKFSSFIASSFVSDRVILVHIYFFSLSNSDSKMF